MILAYDALDATGKRTSDTVEARDTTEAVETLRGRGLFVTRISQATTASAAGAEGVDEHQEVRLPLNTLVLFTRQLAMLLRAGSALVPAITAIKRQMKRPQHATLLGRVINSLEDGESLTDALRKHPRTFDPVYCAIIAAGEASASLPDMFERLAGIVGARRTMRKKVLGALAYPALLIGMCGSILQVLLFFVLPRFATMFDDLGVDLPASTEFLLGVGELARGYWHVWLVLVVAMAAGVVWILKSDMGRQWLSNIQIKIPLIGPLRSKMIQGEIFRTMGMLLESRVGLLDTLELARKSTKNKHFQKLFDNVESVVTGGGQPSDVFAASKLVEPYICQAIRTGEDSGNLGGAISYCADILDESNTELVNVVARLIEPVILIGMGFIVGGVAISLFLPLFELTSAVR